jgi:glycosyltransferase involved in cell wall biosynthesis
MPALDFLLPGSLRERTGGTIYDRHITAGLSARGWNVAVHSLDPAFPFPSRAALDAACGLLAALPPGRLVVFDGLVLGAGSAELTRASDHLTRVALVHHPLALEAGLDTAARRTLGDAERAAWAKMQRIIVTSRWTARRLAADGVPAEQLRVAEPGTERPAGVPARSDATGTVNLLCVASLTPRKRHGLLFDALARLQRSDWRLRCAGSTAKDPATAAALDRQIERLGLGRQIELLGELAGAALEAEYRSADLFVLASDLEGYGMAAAEALVHGLPVVATAGGALADTVPPKAGVLVPPGEPGTLAEVLEALLADAGRRAELAAGARAAGAALPSWDQAAAAFAAALDRLAA